MESSNSDTVSPGDKKERYKTTCNRFCILVVADDCVTRKALVELVNREPDIVVCGKAQSTDQALNIMEKQQVACAIVSTLSNHTSHSFVREVALRHPDLVLPTVNWDLRYPMDGSKRPVEGEIVAQRAAKDIMDRVNYVQTLLESGMRGFVMSSRIRESVTDFQGC